MAEVRIKKNSDVKVNIFILQAQKLDVQPHLLGKYRPQCKIKTKETVSPEGVSQASPISTLCTSLHTQVHLMILFINTCTLFYLYSEKPHLYLALPVCICIPFCFPVCSVFSEITPVSLDFKEVSFFLRSPKN